MGLFSVLEMDRRILPSNRIFLAWMLLPLFSVPGLMGQTSVPSPSISLPGTQSPFTGSQPEDAATAGVLQLSFQDAIDRGLRNNLGLLLSGDQTITARGERWKELANLLPDLEAHFQENVETLNLETFGFKSNVFPFPLPRVIGPFNYFDARASVSQNVFNFKDLEQERAATERLKSAKYSYKDAREVVVLAVGNG